MNKFWRAFLGLYLMLSMAGCSLFKPAAAPLPTGAINSTDAQINALLQAGHAAVQQYNTDVSGGFVPTSAYKTVMQNLTTALNVADPLYQTYHATLTSNPELPEPTALAAAVGNVQSAIQQIPTTVGK